MLANTGAANNKICRYDTLTDREQDLIRFITSGMNVRQAADQMSISYHTARKHLQNIYDKTGVNRQSQLWTLLPSRTSVGTVRLKGR